MIGKATADDQKTPLAEISAGFAGDAPLWAYILSEAQVTSWERAGSVSPRTLSRSSSVRWGDGSWPRCSPPCSVVIPTSYLNKETRFSPIPEFTHDGNFGLAELINVALGRTP